MRTAWPFALLALSLAGCESKTQKAIERIEDDKAALGKVTAVVNEVIRNSADCTAAKASIPEAYQRIDEARGQLTAPASQQTLDALKVQVDRVAQVCP
jgi:hypothetical protein